MNLYYGLAAGALPTQLSSESQAHPSPANTPDREVHEKVMFLLPGMFVYVVKTLFSLV